MKLNKRGVSLVEIIVSIALISIVLILLINLFMSVRNIYNNGKIEADYEMLKSTVIDAIGNDIDSYQLKNIEDAGTDRILLIFKAKRPTRLSENIKKVLSIYERTNDGKTEYYISYVHDYEDELTSSEKTDTVIRQVPKDSVMNAKDNRIIASTENGVAKIKIPIRSNRDVKYDINIYGLINTGDE